MRVLGIDPGFGRLGYGCLEVSGDRLKVLTAGCFETPKEQEHALRLQDIAVKIQEIIRQFGPGIIGIEKLFFSKNVRTAMKVSEARGVVLASLASSNARIVECSPQEVKIAVTGYGRAEKQQVQRMVKTILGLSELPKPDDAADALAVAIAVSRM